MSFHSGRGCPRGRGGPGVRTSTQTFRPQNLRQLHPQQPSVQYQYDQQVAPPTTYSSPPATGYVPPRPDFIPYPSLVPPSAQSPISQCPMRPPFPNHQVRQSFPVPPCFPPAPPPVPNPSNSPVPGAPSGQNTFPYMMPPPAMPHPPPPPVMPQQVNYQPVYSTGYSQQSFPPPNFNSYQHNSNSFQSSNSNSSSSSSSHFRHTSQYQVEKTQSERRSPERSKHYDEHRHRDHSHVHGDRHRPSNHGDRRDRGRSPDRRRQESSRHRSDYDRGRTPPRHRSYERSRERERERHRHRDSRGSPSSERSYKKDYKRTGSRSPSRERKRPRWEEERERWSENQSANKEKSYTAIKDKEPEEIISEKNEEEDEELLKPVWVRCTHSESYYSNDPMDQVGDSTVVGTSRLRDLYERFEEELGKRQEKAKAARPPWEPPKTKLDEDLGKCHVGEDLKPKSSSESDCDSDENSSCSSSSDSEVFDVIAEIKRKKAHPDRLHEELWYNDPGQMNDGPLCKCSAKARRTGIRHSIYPGEEPIKPCRPMTNNAGRLYHYRITVSPPTNFLTDRPTVIEYDDHEYIFEGFSMFAHAPLTNIPLCKVIRFNIDYTIHFIEEMMPEVRAIISQENFCVRGLELFSLYLFRDILELYDWNLIGPSFEDNSCCPRFHFMPRFVRFLPDGGKEVLSMHQILLYLLRCNKPLVPEEEIANMLQWEELEWQKYAEECKGMIVTSPGMKPSSVRIDQLDREQFNPDVITFPIIVHFGIRPAQLSYAGDPQYQKLWKSYVKLRHLLANSPKVKQADKQKLSQREEALQKIRQKNTMRREVTVELSSQGFWKTGIRSDVCQHAMMLPVLTHHIRYHQCLMHLDKLIGYTFQDRCLLQLAMTHPSHHLNFGMNPDHARNSLSNCGIRQPKYGDRKVHHMHMRKKGINTLINIMSRLGQDDPTPSRINHNERLEFLGDAVVEFLTRSLMNM
ncbi:ribonuclease 3 isoform X5 [Chrysemys picta bellii]|uniref:ribonuclease 3 isoform X5 n=1 Tax=Chrysemys picta bellii TaxID=8478 RepID=UPI0032B242C4